MDKKSKNQTAEALANLQGLCRLNNVTALQISEKIGITQGAILRLLAGKFCPQLDLLFRVLNALNDIAKTSYGLADIDPIYMEDFLQ